MVTQVLNTPWDVAKRAAAVVAEEARAAVLSRGRFLLALSGGKTPWKMLKALAREVVPWDSVHVFQVDERAAPEGHPDRNMTSLRDILQAHTPLPQDHLYGMPVEEDPLEAGAARYYQTLCSLAGTPPVLDLVHLGLGVDGHAASLLPGDPILSIQDRDVATTGPYFGRRRMSLTYPILNRARKVLWVVTGEEKAPMLKRLKQGDPAIPAGRINPNHATILADRSAAPHLTPIL